jgi:hypothetical protein
MQTALIPYSEVLSRLKALAETNIDPTMLVALAAPAFIFPLERLDKGRSKPFLPPMPNRVTDKLKRLLDTPIRDSVLWHPCFEEELACAARQPEKELGDIGDLPWEPPGPKRRVRFAAYTMRHALAHGNVLTFGSPVEQVYFFTPGPRSHFGSDPRKRRWNALRMTPRALLEFLLKWGELMVEVEES